MEVLHVERYARAMTLDNGDLDMRNCAIGNLLITDLARAETLDDVWSCELDGPKGKLESSHRDEVGRKERNRVESLEYVRFCELGGK
jgi:hypothetical protein